MIILFCICLETKEVYEGEVTELTPVETENPVGGFSKTVSHVVIGNDFSICNLSVGTVKMLVNNKKL